MSNVKNHHESAFHISKRDDMPKVKAVAVRAISILIALLVCAVVIVLLSKQNPIKVFGVMFEGSFGTSRRLLKLCQNIAMLLCISLAVTPAFKMKFWNIGAEGQTLVGCLVSAIMMLYFGQTMPLWILLPLMLIVSILAGVIWGIIPAFFKANFGTNETLFTLMMNYVATQVVSVFIAVKVKSGSQVMGVIQGGWMPKLFGKDYLINIIIVLLLTVGMYIYFKYSKHGYEISVVGESENTARYIGINVKKVIMRTMALSGGLCGVAGFLLVAGEHHTVATDTVGGMGFTAIMVSWLAKFNPVVMMLVSFLIAFMESGAGEIATQCGLNHSIADILTGIIIFFIIGSEFFVQYKINFRQKHKEA